MPLDLNTLKTLSVIISPFLLLLSAGLGWLYRSEKEHRRAVERQLSKSKYKTYITILNIFFDTLKDIKAGNVPTMDQVSTNKMIDAEKDLLIYGSDDVVKTFQEWLKTTREGKPPIRPFSEIIISIRQDMGNKKTKITSEDVLRQLIVDYEDVKAKGLI